VRVDDYLRDVLVPANVAVSAMQRAGLPIDLELLRATRREWLDEVVRLERFVEAKAEEVGTPFKYSAKHGAHPPKVANFLFNGLKLLDNDEGIPGPDIEPTKKGNDPSGADQLARWASLRVPLPEDDTGRRAYVKAVLQIRSLAKGVGTYLDAFERTVRSDGCCHPKISWALRTARLSAEDPPVHQIPERSEKRVPDGVKACIVPRVSPARDRDAWDPRKHGSCFRWDISGAEAAIRAAMLTHRAGEQDPERCVRDPIAWEYLREGKDIHSKTASLIYGVPEGTYKKGSYERDGVGKPTFFAKIFGAKPMAVRYQFWDQARIWLPYEQIEDICSRFDDGYVGLVLLYEKDKRDLGLNMDADGLSWCEDAYGRRRAIQVPKIATRRFNRSTEEWDLSTLENMWRGIPRGSSPPEELQTEKAKLNHAFHVAANTPTQSTNATDTLWMLALCYLGEYVPLRVPPIWERGGIPFPEAAGWQMHGGPGPGGKPFLAWHCNTVHDSGWGDCAPGYLEPTAKLLWRRCTSVPLDWRLESDVPYRIELKVGPDMARMRPYNAVAKEFGMEPVPER
jgi:hypothetical protein